MSPPLSDLQPFEDGVDACGVYFLINQGQIVYIGQSISIARRVAMHRKTQQFDEVRYIAVDRKDLNAVERKFIHEVKPERNGFTRADGSRDYCAPPGFDPTVDWTPHKKMNAEQLQKLLARHGVSQRAAAKGLGINERTMRKYCAGDLAIPKIVEMAVLHMFCEQTDAKRTSD